MTLDWRWLGGWWDAEGYFSAVWRKPPNYREKTLFVAVGTDQKYRPILDRIAEFIEKETGFKGEFSQDPRRKVTRLRYRRLRDAYILTHILYSYLEHEEKRKDAAGLMLAIQRHARHREEAERKMHRMKYAEEMRKLYELTKKLPPPDDRDYI